MSQDFYDVLGVSRDADEDEIKEAYREKAREYHPDVSDDPNAEEKFKQAKKAKEVLTDDEQRRMYDQMGHEQFEQAEKRGGAGGGGGMGGMGGMGGQGNPFGGGGGGMGDLFDQFFGGGGSGQQGGPRQGRDLRTRMNISMEAAYEGITREFTVTRPEACPDCDGEGHPPDADAQTCPECNGQGQTTRVQQTPLGRVQQRQTCPRCEGDGTLYSETCSTCGGDGRVQREATLQVDVPAGIRDGQTLRMSSEGAPGENGGPKGDLLIEVGIDPHPDFERDGDDLHYDAAVSFPKAVFGASIEVPTLDGLVEMDLDPGTQSGERFRLKNKGMPRLRGRGHGDLYVTVQVVTPTDLSSEQKEALEQFAEAGGEEVEIEEGFFEKIKNSF
ncbi:MAG: molecular chaperone DnaJ [Halobacteriales archaeon]|nr:molecular chaperone DnaJ [Halobacteriales archaeon]